MVRYTRNDERFWRRKLPKCLENAHQSDGAALRAFLPGVLARIGLRDITATLAHGSAIGV